MKYRQILFGLAVAAVLAGCSPELAQAPLGPKEEKWSAFIEKHYPGWESPRTTPPGSISDPETAGDNDASTQEVLKVDSEIESDSLTVEKTPGGGAELIEKKDVVLTADPVAVKDYTVVKGDNLYKISKKVYGTGNKWKTIFEANKASISEPGKIKPGTKLLIPQK